MFKIRDRYLFHYIDSSLSIAENIRLIEEQIRIERLCLLTEVADLRAVIDQHGIKHNVSGWRSTADSIYKRMYSYQCGQCGKLIKEKKLLLPYSYRRTVDNFFS